jgi:cytochrome c oxidase subunit IV
MAHPTAPSPQSHGEHAEHGSGGYLIIWIVLLALTLLTWWTGRMHLPTVGIYLAMFIASVKATLVILFFMHLWEQKGVNRVVIVSAFIMVATLMLGTFADVATRSVYLLPKMEVPGAGVPGAGAEGH